MADDEAGAERPRILVVDDDPAMQRMISTFLGEHRMEVETTAGRRGLFQALAGAGPDLVLLDINLGEDDGVELLREVRTRSIVPVILITGHRGEEIDRIMGLELGADDYVLKPFSLRELLARIRAVLRRRAMDSQAPTTRDTRTYVFAGWRLDQRARRLTDAKGAHVSLTRGEHALLSAFVLAPGRSLTREHLLQATRNHEDVFDRSIDVQILRLRRKLKVDPGAPDLLRTERGVGYLLAADVRVL